MGANSTVERTDHTFNPWIENNKKVRVRTSANNWATPLAWQRNHEAFFRAHGRRQRVFCASSADVFDLEAEPEWLFDLIALTKKTPDLDWLLLTTRIGNFRKVLARSYESVFADPLDIADFIQSWIYGEGHIPRNIWLGITVVNQSELDRDLPKLLEIPARVRFLSAEPMLSAIAVFAIDGHVEFRRDENSPLYWVTCGSESGHPATTLEIAYGR